MASFANKDGIYTELTKSDMYVVLGICLLLSCIAVPACLKQQQSSRRQTCLDNIRNVGSGFMTFRSQEDVRPALVSERTVSNSLNRTGNMNLGWPVLLLPAVDQSSLLRQIIDNGVVSEGSADGSLMVVGSRERINLPIYRCPDDIDKRTQTSALSYVVNVGFLSRELFYGDPEGRHRLGGLSWDNNNVTEEPRDVEVSAATGVIWRRTGALQPSWQSIDDGDGSSLTFLLTENLQAGRWYDTDTTAIGFGLPVFNVRNRVNFGPGEYFNSPELPLDSNFPGNGLASAGRLDWKVNLDLTPKGAGRPRPSSRHQGGVHMLMCDGSGRFINEKMDIRLYVQMITPNGAKFGEKQ